MARRPYSTDARFFKDSDQVVRIRWYPVTEPVEVLPFPSKINSLDWSSHPWLAEGVGEVYGEPRPYNGAKALPYAVGLTPCKPAAVFVEGEVLDPDAPPQVYNLDQFPACCLDKWVPEGGVTWNGSATVTMGDGPFDPGTCPTLNPLTLGQWHFVREPSGVVGSLWFSPAIPPGNYVVNAQFVSGTFVGAAGFSMGPGVAASCVQEAFQVSGNLPSPVSGTVVVGAFGTDCIYFRRFGTQTTSEAIYMVRIDPA